MKLDLTIDGSIINANPRSQYQAVQQLMAAKTDRMDIQKMLFWLQALAYPDNKLAFAHELSLSEFEPYLLDANFQQTLALPVSGYYRLQRCDWIAFVNLHNAKAKDFMTFEFAYKNQPIFTATKITSDIFKKFSYFKLDNDPTRTKLLAKHEAGSFLKKTKYQQRTWYLYDDGFILKDTINIAPLIWSYHFHENIQLQKINAHHYALTIPGYHQKIYIKFSKQHQVKQDKQQLLCQVTKVSDAAHTKLIFSMHN